MLHRELIVPIGSATAHCGALSRSGRRRRRLPKRLPYFSELQAHWVWLCGVADVAMLAQVGCAAGLRCFVPAVKRLLFVSSGLAIVAIVGNPLLCSPVAVVGFTCCFPYAAVYRVV